MHKKQTNAGHRPQCAGLLRLGLQERRRRGRRQLDFVPLPAAVKGLIRKSWAKIQGPDGKPVYPVSAQPTD